MGERSERSRHDATAHDPRGPVAGDNAGTDGDARTADPGTGPLPRIPLIPLIEAVQGDVVVQQVDAVVNAANSRLAQGAGVCGAIFRSAGAAELQAACDTLGGCQPGDAKVTEGFSLPARWIIHTVGPIWQGGAAGEDETLARCYRRSLEVAGALGARSVAFPAISTGIYGFPPERAAAITVRTVRATPAGSVALVRLVAFDRATLERYQRLLDQPPAGD